MFYRSGRKNAGHFRSAKIDQLSYQHGSKSVHILCPAKMCPAKIIGKIDDYAINTSHRVRAPNRTTKQAINGSKKCDVRAPNRTTKQASLRHNGLLRGKAPLSLCAFLICLCAPSAAAAARRRTARRAAGLFRWIGLAKRGIVTWYVTCMHICCTIDVPLSTILLVCSRVR